MEDIEGLMRNHLLGEPSICLVWFGNPQPLFWLHSVFSVVHFGF